MFDSDILEVAIGLAMVFALVSTICTAVRELIESWLKTRASYLEYGIRQLLNDPQARGIARDVFDHPLVSGLYIGNYEKTGEQKSPAGGSENNAANDEPPKRKWNARNKNLPSYIPSASFAKALIDVVARGPAGDITVDTSSQPITLARVRGNLAHIDNPHLQRALLSALDAAEGDLNRLRTNIEAWYDSAMDRVSGWYKRTTQKMLFFIALAVAIVLNVNTITIADYLFRHDAERTALVANIQAPSTDATQQKLTIDEANEKLSGMGLPIGWPETSYVEGLGAPRTRAELLRLKIAPCERNTDTAARHACAENAAQEVVTHSPGYEIFLWSLVGWLLTACAATLGAPFWFDVLSKFMTVRSTFKPREEEKKKEAPKTALTTSQPANLANAMATADAHAIDDQCGVGANIATTPDDRLPAATGGVA
jgi:hypothetical protein